ncbi:MAG: DUF2510 domain-containing protein [Coriobacteriia bacterium]|nr:DUF2510 domain-containing protein [Coriobacteriia bacterium]
MKGNAEQVSTAPGWYEDPSRRHASRYWDGAAWSEWVADGDRRSVDPLLSTPAPIPVPPPPASLGPIARRAIWMAYALPITLFIGLAVGAAMLDASDPLGIFDAVLAVPWLVALHLHIWNKRVATALVWRAYAVAYLIWLPLYLLVLDPVVTGTEPELGYLVILALLAPSFVALYLYAFSDWSVSRSL